MKKSNTAYLFRNLILIVLLTVTSCKDNSEAVIVPETGEHRAYNLTYGNDARNKLDVYLPANRNQATPLVLLVHGGSWVGGDKADFNFLQDSLLRKGIASASMSYRYASNTVHYPQLMEDVGAAIDYCYSKQTEWNIRGDKYILCGFSAGAHMSLLYGYDYDAANRVGGIISAAGPTDIGQVDWLNYAVVIGMIGNIQLLVGAIYTPGQPLDTKFAGASPINHIKNVPTLILHGTADPLVPYVQAQNLNNALNAANYVNKLVTFPDGGHDLGVSNNPIYYRTMMTEIEGWCKTYGR